LPDYRGQIKNGLKTISGDLKNMEQKGLFDKSKNELKFEQFDRANPKVWEYFCRFALQAANRKRKKIGARLIFERIRWEIFIVTNDEEFKINNNHAPYYARKFQAEFPEHAELFEIRKIRNKWS